MKGLYYHKYLLAQHKKRFLRQFPEPFRRTGAIFTHIPKAAGISVCTALFGAEVGHHPLWMYRDILGAQFEDYFKFTFVRNPYDRFVSAYHFLRAGGMAEHPTDRRFKTRVLERYSSIDDFVNHWLTPDNAYGYIHFFPQHFFLCDPRGRLLVDFIGRFEHLEEDFRQVARRLGSAVELQHRNRTRVTKRGLSAASRARIHEVYGRDFELLGYTPD